MWVFVLASSRLLNSVYLILCNLANQIPPIQGKSLSSGGQTSYNDRGIYLKVNGVMDGPFGTKRRVRRPTINLTSLIDILFMLLIFFMLSSTFRNQLGIDISLPKAVTAANQENMGKEITVDASGAIYFNSAPVTPTQLREKLVELLKMEPEAALVLRADKNTPFQNVLNVIDITREVGGGQLVIPTLPDEMHP